MNSASSERLETREAPWLIQHGRAIVFIQITLAAAALMFVLFLGTQVSKLLQRRNDLVAEIDKRDAELQKLKSDWSQIKEQRDALQKQYQEAKAELLGGAVEPKVRVRRTSDPVKDHDFEISLAGEESVLQKIDFVQYDLGPFSSGSPIKRSQDRSRGFSVKTGPQVGCLRDVRIEVYINNHTETFFVDLCDALERSFGQTQGKGTGL